VIGEESNSADLVQPLVSFLTESLGSSRALSLVA
jgi:hypothetical protein